MINQVYRLVSARQIEVSYTDRALSAKHVVIRPTHLSICAADQRYYTGSRGEEVMQQKLPMALIHEAVGEVAYDPEGILPVGTKVVMMPNHPVEEDPHIGENYLPSSKFSSSGYDGFMQDYVFLKRNRICVLPDDIDMTIASFTELVTVAMHAIARFEAKSSSRRGSFGVWGDGNLGFITSLLLKFLYPNSHVTVFGKTGYKLSQFSFVDKCIFINDIPADYRVDHAFECVGGKGSQDAINQMIVHVRPEATLSLLGVSEYPTEINTRLVLEKGLLLIGSSRSNAEDFQRTVDLYTQQPKILQYLATLVGFTQEVTTVQEVIQVFEKDLASSWGKSVMLWKI